MFLEACNAGLLSRSPCPRLKHLKHPQTWAYLQCWKLRFPVYMATVTGTGTACRKTDNHLQLVDDAVRVRRTAILPSILFNFVHSSVLLCGQGFSMGFHCTARWVRDARRWFQLWRHESSCALCKQARLSEAEMQVMTSVDLQRNDLWQQ